MAAKRALRTTLFLATCVELVVGECSSQACLRADDNTNVVQMHLDGGVTDDDPAAGLLGAGGGREVLDQGAMGTFPDWYYKKLLKLSPPCAAPTDHIYKKEMGKMYYAVNKFFKKNKMEYSLWAGSLIAVVRAKQQNRPAKQMPWDFDADFILKTADKAKLKGMVKSILKLNISTPEKRKESAALFAAEGSEYRLEIDGGFTILCDGMFRVVPTEYARGDLSSKYFPMLMEWSAEYQNGKMNLDVAVEPGKYGDIIHYRVLDDDDKMEPCQLEGVAMYCLSKLLHASSSMPEESKRDVVELLKTKHPFGVGSELFTWEVEDHTWNNETCEYKQRAGEGMHYYVMKDNFHIKELDKP